MSMFRFSATDTDITVQDVMQANQVLARNPYDFNI